MLTFAQNPRLIGDGRITGAREAGGEYHFFIDTNGSIAARTMPVDKRAVGREEFVSFANEYTEADSFSISLYGQELKVDLNSRLPLISRGLEQDSWQIISAFSGQIVNGGHNPYRIGDTKTIKLTTGEELTLEIWGFNHDDKADGSGKAGITFGMRDLMANTRTINAGITNAGGWPATDLRTWLHSTVIARLPQQLQDVLLEVVKLSTAGSASSNIISSNNRLFLFAHREISGTFEQEGARYEYWQTVRNGSIASNRIKRLANGTGASAWWFTRKARTENVFGFRLFLNGGEDSGSGTSMNPSGVCFGFCV